jgi:hypothetical protein
MDELGISLLGPTPRGWIDLVREDAHGNRDGDASGIEKPFCPNSPSRDGRLSRTERAFCVFFALRSFLRG